MKVRNGFVSNSSSSSFMLVTNKEDLKVIVEQLNSQLNGINHPTIKLAASLLNTIRANAEEIKDEQSLLKEFYCKSMEEFFEENNKEELKGFNFDTNRLYQVTVCSDSGEGAEYYLYEDFDKLIGFKSEKLSIIY